MNFALGPFDRFQRSYAQIYDHYGDFWRFKFSSDNPSNAKKAQTGPVIPPPPSFLENVKSFNRGADNVLTRLISGIQRVSGVKAERRSFLPNNRPQRRRDHSNRRRRQFHQRQNPSQRDESRSIKTVEYPAISSEVNDQYGPPPSISDGPEQVVQALHEK